jgi:hypothetical protein
LLHPSRTLLRSLALALTLAFLLVGFAHAPLSSHFDPASDLTVAASGSPSHEPCGSHDGAAHSHLLCGASVSCFVCAPVDTAAAPTRDQRTVVVASSDLLHRGRESKPPFHPPKPVLVA